MSRTVHSRLCQHGEVTGDELRAWCLSMPEAVETFAFGPDVSVFKTAKGKMFALAPTDAEPLHVSVKCDPDLATDLRREYDGIIEGYHLNKRHWITVTVGADVPDDLVQTLVEDSFDLVTGPAPRK